MEYGLIGEKLGHSFSEIIHKRIGRYDYRLCPIRKEALDAFLKEKDFSGINVTIPYKEAVIPYLDEISPEAAKIGAVNTIVNRGGKLLGFNTDFGGMKAALERGGIPIEGKHVLILGSGGTSKTAMAVCEELGAASILRASRSGKGDCILYEEALCRKETEIILNTTPAGMSPNLEDCPIDLSFFPNLCGVMDVIYNPLRTTLLLEAEKRGIPAIGGLFMLVAQAVLAAEIFAEEKNLMPLAEPIDRELRKEMETIVFIGMPACGKSTIGKALAELLKKEFLDTDELIEEKGTPIPEIFAEKGEARFREIEASVIASQREKRGCILSVGGGAILREENVKNLKRNGRLYFLDAPLSDLQSTADRPLSSSPEALKQRYEERYGIYTAVCDKRIPITRNLEENLRKIQKELQ